MVEIKLPKGFKLKDYQRHPLIFDETNGDCCPMCGHKLTWKKGKKGCSNCGWRE